MCFIVSENSVHSKLNNMAKEFNRANMASNFSLVKVKKKKVTRNHV